MSYIRVLPFVDATILHVDILRSFSFEKTVLMYLKGDYRKKKIAAEVLLPKTYPSL